MARGQGISNGGEPEVDQRRVRKKLYQVWVIKPCHARCGGRKKWLLLAKECFYLLETIVTRKNRVEQFYFLQGFWYKLGGE